MSGSAPAPTPPTGQHAGSPATGRTALVTGGSSGLGAAVGSALARSGWRVVLDARGEQRLRRVVDDLADRDVVALPGDVTDERHRAALVAAAGDRLDLLVLNASTLGPSGLAPLELLAGPELRSTFETNAIAPLLLAVACLPALTAAHGAVITLSSDAAVEHYETWGGYGASKAALDHLAGTLAVEHPELTVYAIDPGDMRTPMHQAAFPGQDISDRPDPQQVVVPLLDLLARRPPSGRYRVMDWARVGS